MSHIRRVYVEPSARRIVCCREPEKCLYPRATEFVTDYADPVIVDAVKWQHGARPAAVDKAIKKRFPDEPVFDGVYDCQFHTSDLIKFKPLVQRVLPVVDVLLAPRYREGGQANGNWNHWPDVCTALRSVGLTIGLAGSKECSFDMEADAKAWDHPNGSIQGSLDLMYGCKLLVTPDSGMGHLGALVDCPMLIIPRTNSLDLTGVMTRANQGKCIRMADDTWEKPNRVVGRIVKELQDDNVQ